MRNTWMEGRKEALCNVKLAGVAGAVSAFMQVRRGNPRHVPELLLRHSRFHWCFNERFLSLPHH